MLGLVPLTDTPVVPLVALRAVVEVLAPSSAVDDSDLLRVLHEAEEWAAGFCRCSLGPSDLTLAIGADCDHEGNVQVEYRGPPIITVRQLDVGYRGSARVVIKTPAYVGSGYGLLFPRAFPPHLLQTNSRFTAGLELVKGWFSTTLTETARKGDQSLAVADSRWLVPGRAYQFPVDPAHWDRRVIVDRTWRPPAPNESPVSGRVPIKYQLHDPCPAGSAITDLPAPVSQAVINYALALLRAAEAVRVLEAEDPYPEASLNAGTRYVDAAEIAPRLVGQAQRLLSPYRT